MQRVRWSNTVSPPNTPREFRSPRFTISRRMSANAIARHYPSTEMLFEQLQINRCVEGYETVEELAWRHGMETSQLIKQLRQAAAQFPSS